jgi:hypothetical protein
MVKSKGIVLIHPYDHLINMGVIWENILITQDFYNNIKYFNCELWIINGFTIFVSN